MDQRISGPIPPGSPTVMTTFGRLMPRAPFFFVEVLDAVLVDEQVGLVQAMDFQAVPVVPFDPAVKLLAVLEHHHQRGLGPHLLQVVKIFGVGLLRRYLLPAAGREGAAGTGGAVEPGEPPASSSLVSSDLTAADLPGLPGLGGALFSRGDLAGSVFGQACLAPERFIRLLLPVGVHPPDFLDGHS